MNANTIETRLTATYRRLGARAVAVTAEDWHLAALSPAFRYGWLPPVASGPAARAAFFSPDLLEATTAHLDDAELDRYLGVIETMAEVTVDAPADAHPLAVVRFVEDRLHGTARGAELAAAAHLELRAADLGIIPATPLPDTTDPDERRRELDACLTTGPLAASAYGYPTARADWLARHPAGVTPPGPRRTFEYHPGHILDTTRHLSTDQFLVYVDALTARLFAGATGPGIDGVIDIDAGTGLWLTAVALHHHHTPATFHR